MIEKFKLPDTGQVHPVYETPLNLPDWVIEMSKKLNEVIDAVNKVNNVLSTFGPLPEFKEDGWVVK